MYDFVIVGAGSAGCVLANRLSENGKFSVCILEAGGENKSPLVSIPMMTMALTMLKNFHWPYYSTPQKLLQGRKIFSPRGKGLGGSSAINGMMYIRGHDSDYDRWEKEGAKGWNFKNVLPYFKRSQHQERGGCERHGNQGPLNISDASGLVPFNKRFIQAAQEMGYPLNPDFNGPSQEGVGEYQFTIKNGKRHSTAAAFLNPVKNRPNIHVITHARVSHIEWQGKRATGVNYQDKTGTAHRVNAKREVILCGGSFNSPQLLMLSGVGPRQELNKHGIDVMHDLPGVGQNLQEHVDIVVVRNASKQWRGPLALNLYAALRDTLSHLRYFLTNKGAGQTHTAEIGGFFKSSPEKDKSDLQWHFMPGRLNDHGHDLKMLTKIGYSAHVTLLRPKSRGQLTLNSASPTEPPKLNLNMLSHPQDVKDLVAGLRKTRDLLQAKVFDDYLSDEVFPGPGCQSDADLEEFVRRKANHIYHPIGTCKMGTDKLSVVCPQLKVHGLQGIRVVDASVMPSLIGGNTNAPTIMIAEKAADMILQDHR